MEHGCVSSVSNGEIRTLSTARYDAVPRLRNRCAALGVHL